MSLIRFCLITLFSQLGDGKLVIPHNAQRYLYHSTYFRVVLNERISPSTSKEIPQIKPTFINKREVFIPDMPWSLSLSVCLPVSISMSISLSLLLSLSLSLSISSLFPFLYLALSSVFLSVF